MLDTLLSHNTERRNEHWTTCILSPLKVQKIGQHILLIGAARLEKHIILEPESVQ